MAAELQARIYGCLEQIVDPCSAATVSPMNLVEMGLIKDVRISEGADRVDVDLRLSSPQCLMVAYMTKEARRLILELPGVEQVEVHSDAGLDWSPDDIHPRARARRRRLLAARAAEAGVR
ncbi:MAG TPA: iron-sulfur cluster assembly protein [Baekduia sp.]|uniref:metal-sulfur cluster assembly factor n=1 Tax=Baekduia sp. TaxID=2600305 RepID=UPI002D773660|nr:iron-sulfur cluster assembly protein [Baekduia sp.]HET6509064.1 iron-sulfur cluster assembly protein [Baekduia sp.]